MKSQSFYVYGEIHPEEKSEKVPEKLSQSEKKLKKVIEEDYMEYWGEKPFSWRSDIRFCSVERAMEEFAKEQAILFKEFLRKKEYFLPNGGIDRTFEELYDDFKISQADVDYWFKEDIKSKKLKETE
jgi:hypothetical protein